MNSLRRPASLAAAVLAAGLLLAGPTVCRPAGPPAGPGAPPMGTWPEGMIFPLFHGARHAGLEAASLDVEPGYWWCTIRNTIFRVEGAATVTSGQAGGLLCGLPLMIHELYESHDEFRYPQLTVDGVPATPLLVYNPDLFSSDSSGLYYDGVRIASLIHPWIEAGVPMDLAAPEAYLRGYELFWLFELHSDRAGETHAIDFDYTHNETALGGWENRLEFDLAYASTWPTAGPLHAELHPDYGFAWIDAAYLAVSHPDGAVHLDGDVYREAIEMHISTDDIEPSAATLAPGATVRFVPWAAFTDLGFTWHQADPTVGSLDEGGLYSALAPGQDEVWLVAEMYGETAHVPVRVTIEPTPSPTPTEPPPPPTPTPAEFVYRLHLNQAEVHAGDRFRLFRWLENPGPESIEALEFLILDCYGQYYFWPSWGEEVDCGSLMIEPDSIYVDVLLAFVWPEGAGWGTGLRFWSALTDPAVTQVYFLDMAEFAFGE